MFLFTTLPPQMTVEDWMASRKVTLLRFLTDEGGRGRLLTALLGPLQDAVAYATRSRAEGSERVRVAWLVLQARAILSRCSGREVYDRTGFSMALGEGRRVSEDVTLSPNHHEVQLAEWIRTVALV